jgi:hypothetical protein
MIANLDGYGRFISGQLLSNQQIRPGGPRPDPEEHALNMIRELSRMDFPENNLEFEPGGSIRIKR